MPQIKTHYAIGAALTALGSIAALPAFAQTPAPVTASPATPASPPVAANGPGPATQPPPAPGTTLPAPTQPAPSTPAAPAAVAPPNYKLQYNGLIDGYYLYDFNNPKFKGGINNLVNPTYDVRNNAPTLALAEINLFANPRPHGFGYKATLIAGDTADINHGGLGSAPGQGGSGTGESRFKNVQQLYGTYNLSSGGAGIDIGKFYTLFGYEVVESNGNYNYSRSLPFTIVPTYHLGIRIYNPTAFLGVNGLSGTFILARALYNTGTAGVQGDSSPAYVGQLNYTDPKGKFVVIEDLGFGDDKINSVLANTSADGGDGSNVTSKEVLSDTNFTYNFNANMLFGLDYTNLSLAPNRADTSSASANLGVTSTGASARYNGLAVYFRRQLTPKDAVAFRLSGLDEHYGGGNSDYRPYEVTGTYEIKAATNFLTRFELRYDNSNGKGAQYFSSGSGGGTASTQLTAVASEVFTF